jgi:hypothetical protein
MGFAIQLVTSDNKSNFCFGKERARFVGMAESGEKSKLKGRLGAEGW